MNKLKYILFFIITVLFIFSPSILQAKKAKDIRNKDIEEIREVYKAAKKFEGSKTTKKTDFYQKWDDKKSGYSNWIKGKSKDAGPTATIFYDNKRISSVSFFNTSPSGDWAEYNDYYYRKDGTLAFILSVHNTFHGDVKIEQRFYYNSSGKLIKKLNSIFDLMSGKPVDPEERGFMPPGEPAKFKTTESILKALGISK